MKFRYTLLGFLAIFYQLFGIPVSNFLPFYEHKRERPKYVRCLILKMAVNIKDLYGNSGNRFEKINTSMNFQ